MPRGHAAPFARRCFGGPLQFPQLPGRNVAAILMPLAVALPRWRLLAANVAQEAGAAGVKPAP